jgi:hypothetical protein
MPVTLRPLTAACCTTMLRLFVPTTLPGSRLIGASVSRFATFSRYHCAVHCVTGVHSVPALSLMAPDSHAVTGAPAELITSSLSLTGDGGRRACAVATKSRSERALIIELTETDKPRHI